ncbi:GAF domain-containing protein, partial [Candidatus Acetothermia bacterium]|nr:GAF domain-containing protein [Candidatus Acetothermia bacterium]
MADQFENPDSHSNSDELTALRQQAEQYAAQLQIINSIQQGLASKLDIQAIYDLVGDKVCEIFDAHVVQILSYDPAANLMHYPYCNEMGDRHSHDPRLPGGFSGHILQTRQPLMINQNLVARSAELGKTVPLSGDWPKSYLGVPLLVGDEVRGVLTLQILDRENGFNESDLRLLQTLASSMSMALENARLFDEVQNRNDEITDALERETATSDILKVIANSPTYIQPVLDVIAEHSARLCASDDAVIVLVEDNFLRVSAHYGSIPITQVGEGIPLDKETVVGRAILEGGTFQTIHGQNEAAPDYPAGDANAKKFGYRMTFSTPLMRQGKAIGGITIRHIEPKLLSDKQVELVKTFADQAAIAVENVRLFNETKEALEQQTATSEVLRALSSSQTDLKSLLEVIAVNAAKVCGADDAHIYRVEGNMLKEWTHRGPIPGLEAGESLPLNRKSLTGRAIVDRQTIHIHDAAAELNEAEYPISAALQRRWGTRTVLSIPLLRDGEPIGGIAIRRKVVQPFTEKQIELLRSFADQAVIAIENVRLFDETQRLLKDTQQRAAELAIINSVQEGLAKQLDLQGIVDLVGDKVREIFNADTTSVTLYDAERDWISNTYYVDRGQRIPFPDGPAKRPSLGVILVDSRKPLLLGTKEESLKLGSYPMPREGEKKDNNESYLGAPILADEKVIGGITVQSYKQNAYNQDHVRLLTTLANAMSVALENARLFDETQRLLKETEQRNAELAILNSVSEAMSKTLDVKTMTKIVGDKVQSIFASEAVSIRLYDPATNLIQRAYDYDRGYEDLTDTSFPMGQGLTSKIIKSGKPLLFGTSEEADAAGALTTPSQNVPQERTQSYVGVPIIAGNRVIGTVAVQSYKQHAYKENDVRLLQTLAANMGVAIHNARLFEAEQERIAELQIINSIQQGLAAELDFQAIVDLVGDKLREVLKTNEIGIRWYDTQANLTYYLYEYEHGQRLTIPPAAPIKGSVFEKMLLTRQPIVRNTVAEREAMGISVVPGTDASKSSVNVPIIGSDRVVGSIIVEDYEKEYAFSDSDVRLLQTVAASMGVALENARLFDETQRLLKETEQRAAELAIINSVQEGLASKLDMQAIYDLVGDKIREIFDAQAVTIATFDLEKELGYQRYSIEKGQRFYSEPARYGNIAKQLIATRQPVLYQTRQQLIATGVGVAPGTEPSKSAVYVPLVVGDVVKGAISLQNVDREYAFTESDVRLLQTFANSMSVALENARLFDETQRRAQEMSALIEVGRDISATLDPTTVLERIARHARDLLQVSDCAVFLPDETGQAMKAFVALGPIAAQIKAMTIQFGAGIIGSIWKTGAAEVINDASQDPRGVKIAGTEDKSDEKLMVAPLLSGDKVIGLMSVWRSGGDRFFEDDLIFLMGLARQATIAIQNARLFNEIQARNRDITEALEQQTATSEILRVIASSPTDVQPVLETVARHAVKLCDAVFCGVYRVQNGIVSLGAQYNLTPEVVEELNRVLPAPIESAPSISAEAVRRQTIIHIADIENEPTVPSWTLRVARKLGYKSIVAIPMLREGEVLGAITVARREAGNFTDKQIALLQTFTNQAVIA